MLVALLLVIEWERKSAALRLPAPLGGVAASGGIEALRARALPSRVTIGRRCDPAGHLYGKARSRRAGVSRWVTAEIRR